MWWYSAARSSSHVQRRAVRDCVAPLPPYVGVQMPICIDGPNALVSFSYVRCVLYGRGRFPVAFPVVRVGSSALSKHRSGTHTEHSGTTNVRQPWLLKKPRGYPVAPSEQRKGGIQDTRPITLLPVLLGVLRPLPRSSVGQSQNWTLIARLFPSACSVWKPCTPDSPPVPAQPSRGT